MSLLPTQPTTPYPDWCSANPTGAKYGQPAIAEPTNTRIASGFGEEQLIPRHHLNWIFRIIHLWIDWITSCLTALDGNSTTQQVSIDALNAKKDVPIGSIVIWPINSYPRGWLICDGMAIPTGTHYGIPDAYAALITAIGDNTPDLRSRFIIGADGPPASPTTYPQLSTGGEDKHALTAAENGTHQHSINSGESGMFLNKVHASGTLQLMDGTTTSDSLALSSETDSSGDATPHNNIPPYMSMYYIIRGF